MKKGGSNSLKLILLIFIILICVELFLNNIIIAQQSENNPDTENTFPLDNYYSYDDYQDPSNINLQATPNPTASQEQCKLSEEICPSKYCENYRNLEKNPVLFSIFNIISSSENICNTCPSEECQICEEGDYNNPNVICCNQVPEVAVSEEDAPRIPLKEVKTRDNCECKRDSQKIIDLVNEKCSFKNIEIKYGDDTIYDYNKEDSKKSETVKNTCSTYNFNILIKMKPGIKQEELQKNCKELAISLEKAFCEQAVYSTGDVIILENKKYNKINAKNEVYFHRYKDKVPVTVVLGEDIKNKFANMGTIREFNRDYATNMRFTGDWEFIKYALPHEIQHYISQDILLRIKRLDNPEDINNHDELNLTYRQMRDNEEHRTEDEKRNIENKNKENFPSCLSEGMSQTFENKEFICKNLKTIRNLDYKNIFSLNDLFKKYLEGSLIESAVRRSQQYPSYDINKFYSECYALTDYLLRFGGDDLYKNREVFFKFNYEGQRYGWDNAIKKYYGKYGFNNINDLEIAFSKALKEDYTGDIQCNECNCKKSQPQTPTNNPPVKTEVPQCPEFVTNLQEREKIFIKNMESSLKDAKLPNTIDDKKISEIIEHYTKDYQVIMIINLRPVSTDRDTNINKITDQLEKNLGKNIGIYKMFVIDNKLYPKPLSLMIFDKNGYYKETLEIDLTKEIDPQVKKIIEKLVKYKINADEKCPTQITPPKECPKPYSEYRDKEVQAIASKFGLEFSNKNQVAFKDSYGIDINPQWFSKKYILTVIIITPKNNVMQSSVNDLLIEINKRYSGKKINIINITSKNNDLKYIKYHVIDVNGNNYFDDLLISTDTASRDNFYKEIDKRYKIVQDQCNPDTKAPIPGVRVSE